MCNTRAGLIHSGAPGENNFVGPPNDHLEFIQYIEFQNFIRKRIIRNSSSNRE
jgi:hypothetical protein